jgi:hypothetical protein
MLRIDGRRPPAAGGIKMPRAAVSRMAVATCIDLKTVQ